ncbi:MAG: SDR family NAD(P)-dependent oxidoreductase [Armatimonadetes bacterium]|nr:SDR family NAD(P)-dependent oxidoreductase [Armatimonadota bacterium]
MTELSAFVTGADRGLGMGLTKVLLERGFRVFAGEFGLDPMGLNEIAQEYGSRLRRIPLDVSSDVSVMRAADKVREGCTSLDILINNAGILGDYTATLSDPMDFSQMLQVYNVNAVGPLRVAQALFGHLCKGSLKKLINISSEAGSMEQSRRIDRTARYGYCMSKSALNVETVILANHARRQGVEVYLIDPGWVRTYMHGELNVDAAQEPYDTALDILATVLDRPKPEYLYMTHRGERYDW